MRIYALTAIFLFSICFLGCVSQPQAPQQIEDEILPVEDKNIIKPQLEEPVVDCAGFSDYDKAFCFSDLAVSRNDIEVCKSIHLENNSKQEKLNIDYCIAVFAFYKQDFTICAQLENVALKDACFIDFALAAQDTQICDSIFDEQNKYSNCYTQIAQQKNDTQICDRINDSDYMNLCNAKISKEVKYCTPVNNSDMSDMCYLQSAWDNQDWKDCAGIRDVMRHDVCLAAIATQLGDEEICKNVRFENNLQNCIEEVKKGAS